MKHRKLRMAWSVAWGIATVVLVALWVFGYWHWQGSAPLLFHVCVGPERYFNVHLFPNGIGAAIFQFHSTGGPTITSVVGAPFWLLVPLSAAMSFAPWVRWRFSLGTLIIAMTLVAAVLGSTVYLLRN
jgi:hypothetical protein